MNIYVDGSYCQITKQSGIGGIIIDETSKSTIIDCFSSKSVAKNSLEAELLGIKKAISKFWYFLVRHDATLYTDCLVIVDAFKRNHLIKGHENLCKLIFDKLKKFNIQLMWIKREKNTIADRLARQARKL